MPTLNFFGLENVYKAIDQELYLKLGRKKMPSTTNKLIAKFGEDLACNYLINNGYTVLARNWHSGRFGEIDIIAQNSDRLTVFVEVKTRKRAQENKYASFWLGQESINFRKRQKILITANSYMAKLKKASANKEASGMRIDIILVEYDHKHLSSLSLKSDLADITHIKDAFVV
jgi:putative endonuclease